MKNNNFIQCPYCDEEIDKNSKQCPYCAEFIKGSKRKSNYNMDNNIVINNSYNILGLDISSTQKQITKRGKDILKYLAIGEIPDFDNDLYFIKEYRNEIYIKEAVDNLNNPKNRLVNFFFGFDIENQDDKKVFELINNKDFIGAISLLKKSDNEKNLAILYSLILLNKDINNLEETPTELAEKLIKLFKKFSNDEKFWKLFEQKFYLYDDLSTDKKILKEFKSNLGEYLSDLFYDISKNIGDDNILKIFNKHFSNTKGDKTNDELDIFYGKLTKIAEKLEKMDISEDGIFDDDEKEELKKSYKEINKLLKKIKDIGLYEDSKTILIRDNLVKALRILMLDISNNLGEDNESLKILEYCLKIVGTDGLKHKIKEEYEIIKQNSELKPIINLIEKKKFSKALKEIKEIKENTKDENTLKILNDLEEKVTSFKNAGKSPLFLFTWWGVGISIYGNTTYFTILWLPIMPLSNWDVEHLGGGQYRFYGKKEMSEWKKWWRNILLGIIGIFILIAIIDNNSHNYKSNNYSSSSSYSENTTKSNSISNNYKNVDNKVNSLVLDDISKCGSNKCEFKGKCVDKATNSYCVENDVNNAWKCDVGYYEKNNYCWCTSGQYSCLSYVSTAFIDNEIDTLKRKISNTYVNKYSQSSIDYYNGLIYKQNSLTTKRNKILNNSCTCK